MLESNVATAVLERARKVVVAEQKFMVSPPTIETMILVSEQVAQFGKLSMDVQKLTFEVLAKGKNLKYLANAMAIMAIGARNAQRRYLWGLIKINRAGKVARLIRENYTAETMYQLFMELLGGMDVKDFFLLITSLCEIAMLGRTTTTPSGQ